MSNSHPTTTAATNSSTNFQLIFNNALKAYEKRTKNDLLAHPLAAELQNCNSPSAILAVLHRQVQALDQSSSSDDRWTKWLYPTVNVLQSFSDALGEGVNLVSFRACELCQGSAVSLYSIGILTWKGNICRSRGPLFGKNTFDNLHDSC